MSRGRAGRRITHAPAAALLFVLGLPLGGTGACRCDESGRTNVIHPFPEKYAGVGLELAVTGQHPQVVRAIAGSAASVAGLHAGDYVIQIDEVSTRGTSLADAVAALRGERGTLVRIAVRRGEGTAVETFVLRRGELLRQGADAGSLDGTHYRGAD